jgi:drug/metabolite transporter (DMT)-like permease
VQFLLPIVGAVLQAASFTLDKAALSLRRVTYKVYTGVSFPLLLLINLAIVAVLRPPWPDRVLLGWDLLLLLVFVGISVGTNLVFYRALDGDSLGELQIIELLKYFPIIVLSGAVFADERRPVVMSAALAAAAVLVWSHWKNHHFRLKRRTWPYLAWALLAMPWNSLLAKELLYTWHPVMLELVRNAGLAVVFGIMFWRKCLHVSKPAWIFLVSTNLLTCVAWIIQDFSIRQAGIVFTLLIFSLLPLLTYFSSVFVLKEKFEWKKGVAFAVVLVAIVAVKAAGG